MNAMKTCRFCSKEFSRRYNCLLHEDTCEKNPGGSTPIVQIGAGTASSEDGFNLHASAFDGILREYKMYFKQNVSVEWLADLYEAVTRDAYKLLYDIREKEGGLFKWYLTLEATFRKMMNPDIVSDPPAYFRTHPVILYVGDTLETLKSKMKVLVEKIDKYEHTGSGWVLNGFVSLTVSLAKFDNPLLPKNRDSDSEDESFQNSNWEEMTL